MDRFVLPSVRKKIKMYQVLKFFVFVLTEVNPFTDRVNDSSGGS